MREPLADRHGRHVPLALKIAPDLDDAQIRDDRRRGAPPRHRRRDRHQHHRVARRRRGSSPTAKEAGGLSGAPICASARPRARGFCPRSSRAKSRSSAWAASSRGADAVEKLDAGASLVQIYTGLIYRGPGLVAECVSACLARSTGRPRTPRETDRRRPDRRSALHRLHALHRRLPGGRDRRGARASCTP